MSRRRSHHGLAALGVLVTGATAVGCHVILGIDDFTKGGPAAAELCGVGSLGTSVDTIDLLFMIDNSFGMQDKTEALAQTLPALLLPLVNPPCIGPDGAFVSQPGSSVEGCPAGSERQSPPVDDLHVGVISSSLGDYGGDSCPTEGAGFGSPDKDQRAHLLSRGMEGVVPTYQGLGFLRYDPTSSDAGVVTSPELLIERATDILQGVGQDGCGYEAQLESWYRFLVDPSPYASLAQLEDKIVHEGEDAELLAQRAAFLRPDSLVLIVMLTDENDCSVNHEPGSPGHFVLSGQGIQMPRAREACAANPGDDCCFSCVQQDKAGCTPKTSDTSCQMGDQLAPGEDHINLRCWDQKRRFGVDFLYPAERYVNALTQPLIDPSRASLAVDELSNEVVDNPLFAGGRQPGLVVLAGLVGVPWQTIARRNDSGQPDLLTGLDAQDSAIGGFMSGPELEDNGVWPLLVGNPAINEPPGDPYMIESDAPRSGAHPVTGTVMDLCQPGSVLDNPINGCEFATQGDDLQYACIHALETPYDCAGASFACECSVETTNPICGDSSNPELLTHSPGRPARRQLEVLRGLGSQAVVASSCRVWEPGDPQAGSATSGAIVGAVNEYIRAPLGWRCPPAPAPIEDPAEPSPCRIVEVRTTAAGEPCDCPAPGRSAPSVEGETLKNAVLALEAPPAGDCFCELTRLEGFDLGGCLNDPAFQPTVSGVAISGWCYVDPTAGVGNPFLVSGCAGGRQLRILGEARPTTGAGVYFGCFPADASCPASE